MGKRKRDEEEERSPLAKFTIGILVITGVLIGLRLILDALGWWSGDPASLTAKIGVGVIVILAALLWWRSRRRKS